MTTEADVTPVPYKDAKTRLLLAGIFEIILAAFSLLLLAVSLLGRMVAPTRSAQSSVLPAVIMFSLGAAILLSLGIGSVNARRWARAIGLCLGWIGLVIGVFGLGFILWMAPQLQESIRAQAEASGQPVPHAAVVAGVVIAIAALVFIYIVIPGAFILFYRGENARLTCEARDPKPRWTDRVPLPVLAAVLMNGAGAVSILSTLPTYGRALLVFGALVTGPLAIAIYLLLAALFAYLTIGFYRVDRRAYWAYVATMVLMSVNSWLSFGGDGMMRVYRALELPPAQLAVLSKSPLIASGAMRVVTVGGCLLMLAWAWFLKRYFSTRTPEAPSPAAPPSAA